MASLPHHRCFSADRISSVGRSAQQFTHPARCDSQIWLPSLDARSDLCCGAVPRRPTLAATVLSMPIRCGTVLTLSTALVPRSTHPSPSRRLQSTRIGRAAACWKVTRKHRTVMVGKQGPQSDGGLLADPRSLQAARIARNPRKGRIVWITLLTDEGSSRLWQHQVLHQRPSRRFSRRPPRQPARSRSDLVWP